MPTPKKKAKTRAGKKGLRAVKAWAGVINDTIDTTHGPIYMHDQNAATLGVFRSRAQARAAYEKVIPVRIVPLRERGAR